MNTIINEIQMIRAALALIANVSTDTDPNDEDAQALAEMDKQADAEYILEVLRVPADERISKLKLIWCGFIRPVVGIGNPDQFAFDKWDAEWNRIVADQGISIDALILSLEVHQPIRR